MPNLDGYKASDYQSTLAAFPEGDYRAHIIASEIYRNSKGNGDVLKLTFELTQDPFTGRQIMTWINIRHATKQCENIGRVELGDICRAVGIDNPVDTEHLHNKAMMIRLRDREDSDFSEIKAYMPILDLDAGAVPASELPPAMPRGRDADIPF